MTTACLVIAKMEQKLRSYYIESKKSTILRYNSYNLYSSKIVSNLAKICLHRILPIVRSKDYSLQCELPQGVIIIICSQWVILELDVTIH